MPDPDDHPAADSAERLTRALEEWAARSESNGGAAEGEREEWIRGHPDIAGTLRGHFAALDVLGRAFPRAEAGETEQPAAIGEFRVLREVGRGGMGVVYEAEQRSLGRRVALKVLYPSVSLDSHAIARFQREARAAAGLHHTNIVPVYAMGEECGLWYYAMELVPGPTLARVIEAMREHEGRRLPEREASAMGTTPSDGDWFRRVASLFAGVADALGLAHDAGVIHRDVKPGNLLADGVLKLSDFGLAHVEAAGSTITATGVVLGTPAYMSPEQFRGGRDAVDLRADVYSLGATLYELLTMRQPFEGGTAAQVAARILTTDPPPPRRWNRRVPRDLETILLKALERDRGRRYATAGEFARDLRRFADGGSIHARRIGVLGRTWRKVKRHKTVSTLAAVALSLTLGGIGLGRRAAQEARVRGDLEYAILCAQAEEALTADAYFPGGEVHEREISNETEALLSRAVALRPERVEVHVLRALGPQADSLDRLPHLEAARLRGLDARTFHLARTLALLHGDRPEEAEKERRIAFESPDTGKFAAFFEGSLALRDRRWPEALKLFDHALTEAAPGGVVRNLILFGRAQALEAQDDLEGAIEELARTGGRSAAPTPVATVHMAVLWGRIGKPERGEALLAQALERVRASSNPGDWSRLVLACHKDKVVEWRSRFLEQSVERFPHDPELRRLQALALLQQRKFQPALEAAERSIAGQADSHFSHELRARALTGLGRHEEALAASELAIRANSSCTVSWRVRVEALRALGRHDDARREMERMVEACHAAYARAVLGDLRLQATPPDYEGALAGYREALRMDSQRWDALNGIGLVCLHRGQWDEAIAHYTEAIRLRPGFAAFHENLGDALQGKKDRAGAARAYREAIRLDADAPRPHLRLGVILLDVINDPPAAEAEFREAVRLQPTDGMAHFNLAQALLKQGKLKGAVYAYREALQADPSNADARLNLAAVLCDRLHDYAAAIAVYREWATIEPRNADIQVQLGMALGKAGDRAAEIKAYQKSAALTPQNARIWTRLATAAAESSDRVEAQRAFAEAHRVDPTYAPAYAEEGRCLHRWGEHDLAIDAYRSSIRLGFGPSGVHLNLGTLLTNEKGDDAGAREAFQAGRRVDPLEPLLARNLAVVMRRMGQMDEAFAALDDWARLAPKDPAPEMLRAHWLTALDRTEESIAALVRAVRIDPEGRAPRFLHACRLVDVGRYEDASEASREALGKFPQDLEFTSLSISALLGLRREDEARNVAREWARRWVTGGDSLQAAHVFAVAGDQVRSLAMLAGLETTDGEGMYDRARVYAVLGDTEAALEALGRAAAAGYRRPRAFLPEPEFRALSQDPRFAVHNEAMRRK